MTPVFFMVGLWLIVFADDAVDALQAWRRRRALRRGSR